MNNFNFVAFDVETATFDPASICEIGIAIVQNSKVVSTKSWLVRPPYNNPSFREDWVKIGKSSRAEEAKILDAIGLSIRSLKLFQ